MSELKISRQINLELSAHCNELRSALAERDAEIKKLQEENRILLAGISTIVDFSRWSLNVMDDSIAKIKGESKPETEEVKDEN